MRLHDDDPGLPIPFGPVSNGEYDPPPLSALDREAQRRALAACDANARRLGVSRRTFLLSMCGAATTLFAIQACSDDKSNGRSGGTFDIATSTTLDEDEARAKLAGDEVIFDVQTHLLDYDTIDPAHELGLGLAGGFPQRGCDDADEPRDCFDTTHLLELLFLRSDTSMAILSAIPVVGESVIGKDSPLSPQIMAEARRVTEAICRDKRLLLQGQVVPSRGELAATLDAMDEVMDIHPVAAWKVYTHAGGPGWYLDDHDPAAPQVGEAFIRKAVETGVPRIAVHKGFAAIGGSAQARYSDPVDIGPAAKVHPDMNFVVYHSGFDTDATSGPYTSGAVPTGVDRLIASLEKNGIEPNSNVYAELGSTWFVVMRNPDQAAHTLGKLLKYVGENNVVWGTDTLWYGTPQPQIQALRAFEIAPEFQERFGYPALTKEIKNKIFGANSMALYGVDPIDTKCEFTRAELEQIRKELPGGNALPGPKTAREAAAVRANDWAWNLS
jgi:hypothetical protein